MRQRKQTGNEGFSLIEVVVAITLLGLVTAPVGASLILSHRLNARSEELMQAQLAVTSAVETLMAEGINGDTTEVEYETGTFPDVKVTVGPIDSGGYAYPVTVASGPVSVRTYIRPAKGGE